MKFSALRGATTIENDDIESIKRETIRLYNAILLQNRIKQKHIICIIAGSTSDITAYYPATALRLNGCGAPLFSTAEPQIEDSLPRCIRLLIFAKCKRPKHIYLNKAENLLSRK